MIIFLKLQILKIVSEFQVKKVNHKNYLGAIW